MMQFNDLGAQRDRIRDNIELRIRTVLDHGQFIMGPEVKEFEEKAADFCGAKHCISCANGTDALALALRAFEIGPGDAVFVPAFTFASTIEVVPFVGATAVMVDVDGRTFNMDPESLKRAIEKAKTSGLRPSVVIPVDLFGLPADYSSLNKIAAENGMRVIADSAQGFGARLGNRTTGTLAEITTTSFFPAKPLGCYGDGGAIFTDDDDLASLIDSLRLHGKGLEKYDNVRIGLNSRLDTLQAAILLEKLAIYPDEIEARQEVADRYDEMLSKHLKTPIIPEGCSSVWAQYAVRFEDNQARESARTNAREKGIPTFVYYPKSLHQQTAYKDFPRDPEGLPNSEQIPSDILCLPMHPYLIKSDQQKTCDAILEKMPLSA